MNAHRDVQILSECHFPNELLPRLRKSRSEYNKFVQGKHTASASELPRPTLGSKFDKFAFAAAMASAIDSALGERAPAIIGDTTPDNIIHIDVLLESFADPRILHVVRDGRDAALTWGSGLASSEQRKTSSHQSAISCVEMSIAVRWVLFFGLMRFWRGSHPAMWSSMFAHHRRW